MEYSWSIDRIFNVGYEWNINGLRRFMGYESPAVKHRRICVWLSESCNFFWTDPRQCDTEMGLEGTLQQLVRLLQLPGPPRAALISVDLSQSQPPGRRFQRWLQGGEDFFALSFRLKSGVKREPNFLLIVFDRYLFCTFFERKRPSDFRALKGVTYQTWKDLSGGWKLPIPISSQDMGMGRMGGCLCFLRSHLDGPIGIDPSQEMKKNTVFAGPQTKWDTDFQPAPGQDEWRQLCFAAAGIWRKEIREHLLALCKRWVLFWL